MGTTTAVRLPRAGHVPEHYATGDRVPGFTWTTSEGQVFVPFASIFSRKDRYQPGDGALWYAGLRRLETDPAAKDSLPGEILPVG